MPDPLTKYPNNIWGRPGFALGAPKPPVGNTKMRLGITEWSEQSDSNRIVADLKTYNVNAFLGVIRRYGTGDIPFNFTTATGSSDLGTGRATWVSYSSPEIKEINSGIHDARIASYFASVPASHLMYFTYKHEVNNNKDDDKLRGATIAEFTAAHARIWRLKQENAKDPSRIYVGPILIPADFRTGTHAQYFAADGSYDFVGVDPYRFARDINDPSYLPDPKLKNSNKPQGTPRTMQYLIGQMPAFCRSVGKPMAFGEYGAHTWSSNLTERARWLQETDTFFEANNTLVAVYFHSARGESGPWLIDRMHTYTAQYLTTQDDTIRRSGSPDTNSMQKFADLLAKYKPSGV